MKPAVWRIFRNNRWTYSDRPSSRADERAAWQPLYTEMQLKEFEQRIRAEEKEACAKMLDEMAAKDKLTNYYKVAAVAIRAKGE